MKLSNYPRESNTEISLDVSRLENVKRHQDGSIRAACPACRANGSDKSGDHLLIQPSGKFGCATNPSDGTHRKEIFALVGIKPAGSTHRNGTSRIVATYDYTDEHGNLLYQSVRYEPKDFKQRRPDATAPDGWTWSTKGVRRVLHRLPEVLRDVQRRLPIVVCEGEKDVAALVALGFSATCNVGGASESKEKSKWLPEYSDTLRGVPVYVIADKDPAGRNHAAQVAASLQGKASFVAVVELPDFNGRTVKDAADFIAAGATVADVQAALDAAQEWHPPAAPDPLPGNEDAPSTDTRQPLTIRTPDELLAMTFDDSDVILGERLLAKGQPLVIAAQGGAGKSRILMQLIAAVVSGRKFLHFITRGTDLRWLILQTENSNRRLQQDLSHLKAWLGDDWPRFNAQVVFHTVENDEDGFVALDSLDNRTAIERLIKTHAPDGIVIDPLNEFAIGDLNKDADMRATLQALSRVCRRGNPERAIIALHHSLTGRGGAVKATGYDRASFARNSKTLHAWTRGQINLAPVDADSNDRLVVACGKCSNGREFETFAVRLDTQTMIYSPDATVDLSEWESAMTGKPATADLSADYVREIVADIAKTTGSPTKAQIVRSIMDDKGCAKGSCYRAIERAERAKSITYTKTTKTYVAK